MAAHPGRYPSIHSSIHSSIHPSIHPPSQPAIYMCIILYIDTERDQAPGLVDAEKYGEESHEHKDLREREEVVEHEVQKLHKQPGLLSRDLT